MEAVEVRHAQTEAASPSRFSYTQAADATTNNESEPHRAALNMKSARESDATPTPRKKLNGSNRSATLDIRHTGPSRTHTPTKSFKQINRRRRQAQNARAEYT